MHDYKIYNTLFARASTAIFVSLKLYYSLNYWKEWGIVWKEGNFIPYLFFGRKAILCVHSIFKIYFLEDVIRKIKYVCFVTLIILSIMKI